MPIANYSTDVPVSRTVGQIMGMLAECGASSITQIIGDGQVAGMEFSIRTEFGHRQYRMPVRIAGVHVALIADRLPARQTTEAHAARVAWRIAHDWLRVNVALIQAGMASLPEVMMPYTLVSGDQTAFEALQAKELEQ